MKAKILVYVRLAFILATIHHADAQQPKKIPRIGVLSGGSASAVATSVEAFRQGLRELRYVEGKNIVVDYRYADGQGERYLGLRWEEHKYELQSIRYIV